MPDVRLNPDRWRPIIPWAVGLAMLVGVWGLLANAEEHAGNGPSAEELMQRAHDARAVWTDFPGFRADVRVSENGRRLTGRLRVTEAGAVEFDFDDQTPPRWAQRQMRSLVAHRMPPSDREYDVSFADDETDHPLGRLIRFHDDRMHSHYRIQDDVITEIHRKVGDLQFTITLVDVHRNEEDRYLPQTYSVNYYDAEQDGRLRSTELFHNQWTRVDDFDLPDRLLVVQTLRDGRRLVRQIEFRDHQLLDPETGQ